MSKYNLELKAEVKTANQDVVIFVSKQRGRRLKFPIDTPVEDYPKFKKLGFNIFRCTECKSEDCLGDCETTDINPAIVDKYTSKEEKAEKKMLEDYSDNTSIEDLAKDLDMFSGHSEEELDAIINGTDKVTDDLGDVEGVSVINYEELSLKDLRKLFPDIKDTSRAGFISKIPK